MKYALIIGNDTYMYPGFPALTAPLRDVEELTKVLADPSIGAFEVQQLINAPEEQVTRAIERFFRNRQKDDLLLLHFSGHGVLDTNGRLHLAVTDTSLEALSASGIQARFVSEQMDDTKSSRIILMLDCCHSGAFAEGTRAVEVPLVTKKAFEGNGYGRWVLTASDETQFAWEGDDPAGLQPSIFTGAVVEGLKTGKADMDRDGLISVRDLADYVYKTIVTGSKRQTPNLWSYKEHGQVILAENPAPQLADELVHALRSSIAKVRLGAVRELGSQLRWAPNSKFATVANAELSRIALEDDSREVCMTALDEINSATENSASRDAAEAAKRDQAQRDAAEAAKRDQAQRDAAEAAKRDQAQRDAAEAAKRDQAQRDAAEAAKRDQAQRDAAEAAKRDQAQRDAAEAAKRDQAQRDAAEAAKRDQAQRDAAEAAKRDQAQRDAAEAAKRDQAQRDAAEAAKRDQAQRDAAEAAKRDQAQRDAAEAAKRDQAQRDAAEAAKRDQAQRDAAEAAKRDQAQRDAAEAAKRDQAQRDAAEAAKREQAQKRAERQRAQEQFVDAFRSPTARRTQYALGESRREDADAAAEAAKREAERSLGEQPNAQKQAKAQADHAAAEKAAREAKAQSERAERGTVKVFRFLVFMISVVLYFAGLGFNHLVSFEIDRWGTFKTGPLLFSLLFTIVTGVPAAIFFRLFSYSNGWVVLCASSFSLGYFFPSASPRPPSFFAWVLPMIWVAIILVARIQKRKMD